MKRHKQLPISVGILVWAASMAATPASAQTGAPFDALRDNLFRTADQHLEQIRERAQREEQKEGEIPKAMPVSGSSVAFGSSIESVNAARERLQALGVDATRIFTEEGVPLELLLLAEVESDFNPLALSPKGARGAWQLMPATATRFGLRVDALTDERVNPARATRAAARYLRRLHEQFGDWLLALAAYNAGEARVAEAVERGGTRDFWRLAQLRLLPEETRAYVPAVLAALRGKSESSH